MDLQAIINKAHEEWKADPLKAQEEQQVISKYGKIFNPDNIRTLTVDDFKSFLNFKNNRHWTGLERVGPEIYGNMDKFKRTLNLLLDERVPIGDRIRRIRDKNSPEYHKGFGTAYYTAILLVVYPQKYPVVNKIVKNGLHETGIYPDYDSEPEWDAYPNVLPKIVELAKRNNLSLWQMDWVWWSLHKIFDYEEIIEFISSTMDTKATYQPVMIKTILEKDVATKEQIDTTIRLENPHKRSNFKSAEVYEVLVDKHKIVKLDSDGYRLNLIKPLTQIQRENLIELCNQEIIRIKEYENLLEKKVSQKHLDILKKYHKKRGKYLRPEEIYGQKKAGDLGKSPVPADDIVNEPHYMHNLVTGVFWLADDPYALSIQLNPTSKWELEIDRNHPTLRINYDFGTDPKYKLQIQKLQNCFKNDIPIGIIFKTIKAKNKILGLGKISSVNNTKYVIDSYGISERESNLLKEETINEFDKSLADPELSRIDDVDYTQFLSTINFESDKFIERSNKNPESRYVKINRIIENCETGEWVIPNFQRYFAWSKEDIRDFLRSIFLDYYVGSLLLWDSRKREELDVIPVSGVNENQNLIKNSIVLDGQQRITSLYYAIVAPDYSLVGDTKLQRRYFYIDFAEYFTSDESDNLIKVFHEKIDEEESYKKMLFPLYHLRQHYQWVFGLEKYLRKQESLDEEKILLLRRSIDEKLRYFYNGYEIPFITLPDDRSLAQITDTFEKINSSGKQLDVFELLIARLSRYKIKLRDLWEESQKNAKLNEYERRKGETKLPINILKSIALCFTRSRSCKRKDILDIYQSVGTNKEDFESKWKLMTKYTLEAISLLENTKDGFGVTVSQELPFEPMIPILASLLKEIDHEFKNVQKKCYDKLQNWYWTSVFSVAYSSSVDSRTTSDFKEMMEWFSNDDLIPKDIRRFRIDYPVLLDLKSVEQTSNAIYRGILCLIALKGGYDFDKNRSVQNRKYHKDHIFPKSKFSKFENINSILNMTWLTADTNNPIKKGKGPSEYIKETIRDKYDGNEKEFLETLESHYINEAAYQCMKEENFEKFIDERERVILEAIREKIGAYAPPAITTMTTPTTPFTNVRIIREAIESSSKYVQWIDKYFSIDDLDILSDSVVNTDIQNIKLLISLNKSDEKMRKNFKRFKEEMEHKNIVAEMRVIIDKGIYNEFHDRWMISKNKSYNLMSGDTARRKQYAELKSTENRPPFEKWWENSLDILNHWDEISRLRNSLR